MGQLLWQRCCYSAEDFCTHLRPKLQEKGFLRDPAEDDVFVFEAMQLHVWLISLACNEDKYRHVLDVFHYIFHRACGESGSTDIERAQFQAHADETAQKRFPLYYKAFSKDKELQAKGLTPTVLARTALRCLLNSEKDWPDTGFEILSEVHFTLSATIKALRSVMAEFTIRGT